MRKFTCAVLVAVTALFGGVSATSATAATSSQAERGAAMVALANSMSTSMEADRMLFEARSEGTRNKAAKKTLLRKASVLLAQAATWIERTKAYQPGQSDVQFREAKKLAVSVLAKAMRSYRLAKLS